MFLTISTTTASPSPAYEGIDQPHEPQLIHFAGIVTAGNGLELDRLVTLVRPVGFPGLVEEDPYFGAITFTSATKRGLSPDEVLKWFADRSRRAALVVGHHIHQDLQNLEATARMLNMRWHRPRRIFSTMFGAMASGIVVPTTTMASDHAADYGRPTLADCFEKASGEPLEGAIGIRSNADATIKVFQHIRWLLSRDEP